MGRPGRAAAAVLLLLAVALVPSPAAGQGCEGVVFGNGVTSISTPYQQADGEQI